MTTLSVENLVIIGVAASFVATSVYLTKMFWEAYQDMYDQKEFWHKKYQYERTLVEKYRKAMRNGSYFDA